MNAATAAGRNARGRATRHEILEVAVDIASAEGLEGLSIGRLADELKLSKSGLFAHFGSKEQLQLATIERASEIFIAAIITPAETAAPGLERLAALLEYWIAYVERSVFRGGCFFAAASAEFDGRPGEVRTRVAELTRAWVELLVAETGRAGAQLVRGVDAEQLIFEAHALVQEANWAWQLLRSPDAFVRARRGVAERLGRAATPAGRAALRQAAHRPQPARSRSRSGPTRTRRTSASARPKTMRGKSATPLARKGRTIRHQPKEDNR